MVSTRGIGQYIVSCKKARGHGMSQNQHARVVKIKGDIWKHTIRCRVWVHACAGRTSIPRLLYLSCYTSMVPRKGREKYDECLNWEWIQWHDGGQVGRMTNGQALLHRNVMGDMLEWMVKSKCTLHTREYWTLSRTRGVRNRSCVCKQ